MNHKDKVSGHKSSEIFCSLQPNFLASLEFSLNLFSNIFQINTSTTFSEFILAVYFWKNCTSSIHVLTPQAIFVAWWVAGSTGTQLTPVNSSPPSFHSSSEILYYLGFEHTSQPLLWHIACLQYMNSESHYIIAGTLLMFSARGCVPDILPRECTRKYCP